MNSRMASFALIALATSALSASQVPTTVDGSDFDQQSKAIEQGVKASEESGVFGRPGQIGDQAPRSSSVGDRELDRYVQRLGFEIRLRNAIADRDESGFR